MDLTKGSIQEKNNRAKKNMMLFSMISMFMTFAGLTSAYIVSSERDDWVRSFEFPSAFYISLATILLSSVFFFLFKKATISENHSLATLFFVSAFVMAIAFVYLQFLGFGNIYSQGYSFTGAGANINASFIYVIVFVHLLHVFGGLVVLLFVGTKHFKKLYSKENYLGIDLASMYWHFVDALWVYLFCFLLFAR